MADRARQRIAANALVNTICAPSVSPSHKAEAGIGPVVMAGGQVLARGGELSGPPEVALDPGGRALAVERDGASGPARREAQNGARLHKVC
jgi:hypothetical protein